MIENEEAQNLSSLLTVYKQFASNSSCTKIIYESGLAMSSLMQYGEFLFIPLICESSHGFFDRYGTYSLRFQQIEIINETVNQTKCFAFTTLHNMICLDRNIESNRKYGNIWGYIKDNNTGYFAYSSFEEQYNKLWYLYRSLNSTGIIKANHVLERDAFFLTVWEIAYRILLQQDKEYKRVVNETIISLKEQKNSTKYSYLYEELNKKGFDTDHFDQQFAIKILYDVLDYNRNDIVSLIAMDTYLNIRNYLYADAYQMAVKIVDYVINNCKQRAYISGLLHRENKPRVNIDYTDSMNPYVFEKLIALVFKKMGFETYTTKGSGDQGIDVIAKKTNRIIAIQAKCYKNHVGNSAIQEVVAGKAFYKADQAYVVTNNYFTKSAWQLARANDVTLWDRAILKERLEELNIYTDEIQS